MKDCHKDQLGFEAISMLHSQIDDDQNGNLDRSESHDVGGADFVCCQQIDMFRINKYMLPDTANI